MSAREERFAQFVLRNESAFKKLRSLPLLGPFMSWIGTSLVPRNALTWVQVRHGQAEGLWLRLNPRTGSSYFEGGGEPEVQEALSRHLRPGMTFYDIGANIGFFSVLAAKLVGRGGRVIAFEADPEIAERLREHRVKNEFDWITVEEKAVWSESGPVQFARTNPCASPDRGLGHVVAIAKEDTIQACGISLDDYAKISPLPDFLKCDVEGAEVEVFRGAARLLKEKRPGIICEMHSEDNQRVLLEQFKQLGYGCTTCGTNHILALPQ